MPLLPDATRDFHALPWREVDVTEAEGQLTRLLDDAPVIVWLTDASGTCTFLNRRWYALTGQTPETGLGLGWTSVVHPDDRPFSLEAFRAASQKREPFRFEYRLRTKEGNYRWSIDAAAPRFGPNGDYLGMIGTVIDIHHRKETEEKLRASEERYRHLFDSIDEGFCVFEMLFDEHDRPVDYRWLEVNPSFEGQTGLRGAVGRTARELVPDLDESWFRIYGKVALTGEPIRFENHAPAMNRWFDVFAFRVDRPEQRRVALLFTEISERKSRELNAAFLADISADFTRASSSVEMMATIGEKLCRHLGADRAAFVEIDDEANIGTVIHETREPGFPSVSGVHRLSDFMEEDFLADLRAGRTVAISDVTTDPLTAGMADAYEQLGVRAHIQASYISQEKWRFMLSVHKSEPRTWSSSDVDFLRELCARLWLGLERMRAEENLRESERQARAFFEGSGVGAAEIGTDQRFRKVNDRLCQITGYSRKHLLQMSPVDLEHPEDRAGEGDRFRRLFESPGFTYDVEKRLVRKNGEVIWVHVNARGIFDEERRPLYLAAVVQDVTGRKRAEEALRESEQNLRELSRSLEQRVAERTAELHEQTLRLRHMAAEVASAEQRERKRLAALLHDDLQQLLVAASMHLSNASRRMPGEANRQAVEQASGWISEATNVARNLTRQLRPPALYEDSLVAALHGLASEMSERHHLNVAIEGEAVMPMSDDVKALLFESIRELLFNTAKYAGVGDAKVRVWEEGQYLRVAVEDRGKGFDLEAVGSSQSRSGFGLFSIRERLAAVGGEMSIFSAPETGTRVELGVPLGTEGLEEPEELPMESVLPASAGQRPPRDGADRRTRVLVVDDHAMVRQGLATLLAEDGRLVVVGEAADGLAAIDAVEHHRPHVALVDVNMPKMNGIEATREIRRRWPETVIIGLSVQDDDATAKAMRDAGASAFVSKAGEGDRMIAKILELAQSRR